MICLYCRKENPGDVEVCGFCGGPLNATSEPYIPEPLLSKPIAEISPMQSEPGIAQETTIQPPAPPTSAIYSNRVWLLVGCLVIICLILGCAALGVGLYRWAGISKLFIPATLTPVPPIAIQVNSTVVPEVPTALSDSPTAIPELITQSVSTLIPGTVTAMPQLLFFDDFSDSNSGWDRVDETDYSTNYYQNAYRIVVNATRYDSWANPGEHVFKDISIDADATKNGGPDDNDFGVLCRYVSSTQYYYGVISSDGYFGIIKSTNDSSNILGRNNLEYSDWINQGSSTNHIRFDCVGDVLSLYVNGQLVDQQTDTDYSSGNVGLIAGTYDTPGTDILFDNFSVYSP
jgi:hypothetical protein